MRLPIKRRRPSPGAIGDGVYDVFGNRSRVVRHSVFVERIAVRITLLFGGRGLGQLPGIWCHDGRFPDLRLGRAFFHTSHARIRRIRRAVWLRLSDPLCLL